MLRRLLLLSLLLVFAILSFACREARMAVPADLTVASQAMPVKQTRVIGWDSPFDFGPFHVSHVKRGWTNSTAWGIIIYESYKASQAYEFAIARQGGNPWQCNCATNVNQQVLEGLIGGGKLTWERCGSWPWPPRAARGRPCRGCWWAPS